MSLKKGCIFEANIGGQGQGWLSIYFSVHFVLDIQNNSIYTLHLCFG